MAELKELNKHKCFGGWVKRFSHFSSTLQVESKFTVYIPPQAAEHKVPTVWFLSGLDSNDENFSTKAGAQREASKLGLMIIAPDTSPRGVGIEGETDHWSFGVGAGFYVDATEPKWSKNYRMYSYITNELFDLVNNFFPVLPNKHGIFGFSMGGLGALVLGLRNPDKYSSVSAFSPISHPIVSPWGIAAFSGYLGKDQEQWKKYDPSEVVEHYHGKPLHILVDQGDADVFLETQLMPSALKESASKNPNVNLEFRTQHEYTHSYYFVATFVDDHLRHHFKYLSS